MPAELDPQGVESAALLGAAKFDRARVLEVGAGDGRCAFRYASASAYVVGIELLLSELRSAQEACPSDLQPRITFAQASALALPFASSVFDIAVLAWSL